MAACIMLMLSSFAAFAQAGAGSLRGTITTGNNQPVPFATVTVLNSTLGATADQGGHFAIAHVPAGRQTMAVSSVVEELRGHDEALSVARLLQYNKWQPGQGVVLGKLGIRPPTPLAAHVPRDPVCQMAVTSKTAPTLTYQGISYHFCSAGCQENFWRHPAQYVKK